MVRNELSDEELIARYVDPCASHGGHDQARLIDSGVSIWVLINLLRDPDTSVDDVARDYQIDPIQVEAALAFYREHRELIDARILLNNAAWDEDDLEPVDVPRNYLLRSVISSLALEGVEISYAEASRLLDEVDNESPSDHG